MKSAGVVILGAVSTGFTLTHYNEILAALTGTGAFVIVALKIYRDVRKTFFPPVKQKQQEPKEETTIV